MSQRYRQQENGEISSSGRELQQENDSISNWDTEKQFGGQDDPKEASMFKWHMIFLASCVIAVLYVDPLFLYLPVINQDNKCLFLDKKLKITAICFRSAFDLIYIAYIILGLRCAYKDKEGSRKSGRTVAWKIIKEYLWSYNFLVDILVILPIPQVLVPLIFTTLRRSKFLDIRKVLNLFVLLQYVPRVLRIYLSWKKHVKSSSKIHKSVWIKAAFNIYLYILASHVLGAIWYFFSVQREMACWHEACEKDSGCTPSSFKCSRNSSENYTFLDGACPVNPPNATLFDFGIFQNALESGIVSSTNIPKKIMYCFLWGLRNLSSLGQNLETSTYFGEICFASFISIYGLLLLLYFIGNAQTFMQMATERAAKKAEMEAEKKKMEAEKKKKKKAEKEEEIRNKMIPIRFEIESWMARYHLPDNMKERIINCIQQRLEQKKDFDIEKPILHLSKDLITEIKRHICLSLLKKVVPNLENQGDQNLLAERICESLKPKYYNEDSYILQEGEPLMMLFITQGSVCCFKTSKGDNSMGTDSDAQYIEKGEIWGEELLEWGFNRSSAHKKWVPISTKTVKTTSKVEAFTLIAKDLKNLVPMHTRAAEATKEFVKGVFQTHSKENKNGNSPKMSEQKGTSRLLEDGAPKRC